MTAKKKSKQASGGSRLIASGKKPVTLGLSAADKKLIDRAADLARMPTTVFIIRAAVAAAEKEIAEKST